MLAQRTLGRLGETIHLSHDPLGGTEIAPVAQDYEFAGTRQSALFTDTAAILNYLDLRSIMGCPGDMSTIRYTVNPLLSPPGGLLERGGLIEDLRYSFSIYARFSGKFCFKFSEEKIVMGKKRSLCLVGM